MHMKLKGINVHPLVIQTQRNLRKQNRTPILILVPKVLVFLSIQIVHSMLGKKNFHRTPPLFLAKSPKHMFRSTINKKVVYIKREKKIYIYISIYKK